MRVQIYCDVTLALFVHADEQGDLIDTCNIIMVFTNEYEYTPFFFSHSRVASTLKRSLVTPMVRESVSPSSGFPGE